VTWILCAAAFVNRAGAMVLPFLSLYLGERFGYSVERAGYVVGLFGVGSIAGSVLGGRLADRLGPVRLQAGTLLCTAVWLWLLALIDRPLPFAAGILVLGAFNDAFRPGNVAAVAASCAPFRVVKALALNRLALNAGWSIGPAVGGLLAEGDYRLLFVVDGLSSALAAVLLLLYVPATLGAQARAARDAAAAVGGSPWADRRFLALLALAMLCFVVFLQHFQTLSRHVHAALGLGESAIGALLVINPLVIVLLEMPLVHALRTRAHLPLIAAGALVVGLAYPWLILEAWGTAAVVASILTLTLGEMLFTPFLGAYVSARAPAAARGAYLGAYFAALSVGFVVAPAAGGGAYQRFGAAFLWIACLLGGALAAAGFLWLHRTDPQRV
jgi:predicted MFS family arabinose efflux permease